MRRAPQSCGLRARISRRLLAWGLSLVCTVAGRTANALPPLTPVALSGTQAIGLPAGVKYSGFSGFNVQYPDAPTIGPQGEVAFYATISEMVSNLPVTGLWTADPANGTTVTGISYSHAAGFARGVNYQYVTGSSTIENSPIGPTPRPVLDAAGNIIFGGYVSGLSIGTSNDEVLWTGQPGQASVLAREGSLTGGTTDGSTYATAGRDFTFAGYVMNDAGATAFTASTSTPGHGNVNSGIWSGLPGQVSPVARSGDAAPGISGATFEHSPQFSYFFPFSAPAINANGQVAFDAYFSTPLTQPHTGLWVGSVGNLSLVAKFGDHAPGTASGVTFAETAGSATMFAFSRPEIGANGQVAFAGALSGAGVTSTNNTGIWAGTAANLALVARAGDHAPGTAAGVVFGNLFNTNSAVTPLVMNASGHIAFLAPLSGPGINSSNDVGIWTGTPGELTLVARLSSSNISPSNLAINALGQVAYSTYQGIWVTDSAGHPTLTVGLGEVFSIPQGGTHSISSIAGFTGGSTSNGLGTGFNDAGQLTFAAQYDAGYGIFVTSAGSTVVPEPGTLALCLLAGCSMLAGSYRKLQRAFCVLLFVAAGLLLTTNAKAATVDTIAISGTQAPDVPAGIKFTNFQGIPAQSVLNTYPVPPTINAHGQVAFYGTLQGAGATSSNSVGIWSGTAGNVGLTALLGDAAGGIGAGVNFQSFAFVQSSTPTATPVPINALDAVAFGGTLTGIGVNQFNDEGLWSGAASGPSVLVREGDKSPPNPPGLPFSSGSSATRTFGVPFLNDTGHAGFWAINGNTGIWTGTAGALVSVAQSGKPAAGLPAGAIYSDSVLPFVFSGFSASDNVAFQAGLAGTGVTVGNRVGLWSGSAGNLHLIARMGDPAPGLPSGSTFISLNGPSPFSSADINSSGSVVFGATVSPLGAGIWFNDATGLHMVMGPNSPAPGQAPGVVFSGSPVNGTSIPLLNAQGEVAFQATLSGPGINGTNNSTLWSGLPGNLQLVAQTGMQAPGSPSGLLFTSLQPFTSTNLPTWGLNGQGQLAFVAQVSDGTYGLWGTDFSGHLREVVRAHDVLEVAPGDLRTVAGIAFLGGSGNSDGRPSGFSDNGEVAFWASFTDGSSGVFVSDVLTVPEPGTLALGLGACALVGLSIVMRQRKKPLAATANRPVGRTFCG